MKYRRRSKQRAASADFTPAEMAERRLLMLNSARDPDGGRAVIDLVVSTSRPPKPVPPDRQISRAIRAEYAAFREKFDRGETEALVMALKHTTDRRGDCGHARESDVGDADCLVCSQSDYLQVPRWVLEAARGAAWREVQRTLVKEGARGQHSRRVKQMEDDLKDIETYRLIEMLKRAGKTAKQAYHEADRQAVGVKRAHQRASRILRSNPDRYIRALEWRDVFPQKRRSHFGEKGEALLLELLTEQEYSAEVDEGFHPILRTRRPRNPRIE